MFIGKHISKVDRKSRVSVPVQFRNALAQDPFQGIIAFCSDRVMAIEGRGSEFMSELEGALYSKFDLYSDEHEDMAAELFGGSVQLPFDGDGRIILPRDLLEHAQITDRAAFFGMGRFFQIWQPEALEEHRRNVRARMRERRLTLPLRPREGGR